MNIRDVARLTMKVFGLYVAFRGIQSVALIIEANAFHGFRELTTAGAITSALLIVLGIIVWFAAVPLADRALGPREPEPLTEAPRATPLDVHSIAFSVLGLYLVAGGFVQLFGAVVAFFQTRSASVGPAEVGVHAVQVIEVQRDLIGAALYFAIGLVLIYSARSLASRVRRIWRQGRGMLTAHEIEIVDFDNVTRARLDIDQLEFFAPNGDVIDRLPRTS